jgi:APA family basic amino acid/polyamine antiporter
VLTYYAITNTAALTLSSAERRTPMAVAVVGVIGCGVLAFTLPWTSVVAGAAMLLVGVGAWWILVHRKHTAG